MMILLTILSALIGTFLPVHAHAQGFIETIVNSVGGGSGIGGAGGGQGFVDIALQILHTLRPLIITIAALMISISAFRMIVGQEDDAVTKARGIFSASIAGVVISFLIEPFVAAFYGLHGEVEKNPEIGAGILSREIQGLINWALVLVSALAVTMIITSAVKALVKSEEGVASMRRTIFAVVAGILLIVFREVLATAIGAKDFHPTAIPAVSAIAKVIAFILTFMGLAAVAVIIYAGVLMVVNFGRDDQIQQAKSLIIRAIIGLIVILVSFSIVQFVVLAATGGG
ncbi:hypothetical protein HY285_01010 [Candidatus Peregrinibacteria bacterium]|nr:hypothetical protein [Candidatus Peregrinibacteria bacterium]MBI3816106.1 hypothetical protein [Candidatus Peregrinibacteria bacterium]